MILEEVVETVMGTNVHRQLTALVPDFFDRDYVVLRMVPRPKEDQDVPVGVKLWPEVVASTHSEHVIGRNYNDLMAITRELIHQGYNVVVSPEDIRRYSIVQQEILDEGPFDRLVIAECDSHWRAFYVNDAQLFDKGKITWGRLEPKDFADAVCRTNVHFAFVPKGKTRRQATYLEKGFILPYKAELHFDLGIINRTGSDFSMGDFDYSHSVKVRGEGRFIRVTYQIKPEYLSREGHGRQHAFNESGVETVSLCYEPDNMDGDIAITKQSAALVSPFRCTVNSGEFSGYNQVELERVMKALTGLREVLDDVTISGRNVKYSGIMDVLDRAYAKR